MFTSMVRWPHVVVMVDMLTVFAQEAPVVLLRFTRVEDKRPYTTSRHFNNAVIALSLYRVQLERVVIHLCHRQATYRTTSSNVRHVYDLFFYIEATQHNRLERVRVVVRLASQIRLPYVLQSNADG